MHTGLRDPNNEPGSILHDNALTIDLRHKPTREDFGFQPGRNTRAYERPAGVDAITTTVELPTGRLRVPAFIVSADAGNMLAEDEINPRPPENIIVQRLFDDPAEVAPSLVADAKILGLKQTDIDLLLPRVTGSLHSGIPQSGVLNGLVRDWLAIWVEVIGYEDDNDIGVNYNFSIDRFHNPAIDKVVHGGIFGIDLTHRPSRADLAFRDTHNDARVAPAWDETLTVRLRLPDGVIERRVSSVDSSTTAGAVSDPRGVGEPRQTIVTLTSSGVPDAERILRADAKVLGIDPAEVDAFFTQPKGHHKATLRGRTTAVAEIEVRLDANLGQPGAFAAGVDYVFTYR